MDFAYISIFVVLVVALMGGSAQWGGAHYAEPPIKATTGPHFVALACGFDGSALMPHSSGAWVFKVHI